MRNWNLYAGGSTEAVRYAAGILRDQGISVSDSVTDDVSLLLLDVPAFAADGSLRGGGCIADLLSTLPKDITVIGGKLNHDALSGYRRMDLLADPEYLARNAAITAHCAVKVTLPYLNRTLQNCPVLILGWGRIGKCLARLLRGMDAEVAVYARNPKDKAMLAALGYQNADITDLHGCRIIYNTVPAQFLDQEAFRQCRSDCVKIELASIRGIPGSDVIIAGGLPGLLAPESSGKLIAETVLRILEKEDSL